MVLFDSPDYEPEKKKGPDFAKLKREKQRRAEEAARARKEAERKADAEAAAERHRQRLAKIQAREDNSRDDISAWPNDLKGKDLNDRQKEMQAQAERWGRERKERAEIRSQEKDDELERKRQHVRELRENTASTRFREVRTPTPTEFKMQLPDSNIEPFLPTFVSSYSDFENYMQNLVSHSLFQQQQFMLWQQEKTRREEDERGMVRGISFVSEGSENFAKLASSPRSYQDSSPNLLENVFVPLEQRPQGPAAWEQGTFNFVYQPKAKVPSRAPSRQAAMTLNKVDLMSDSCVHDVFGECRECQRQQKMNERRGAKKRTESRSHSRAQTLQSSQQMQEAKLPGALAMTVSGIQGERYSAAMSSSSSGESMGGYSSSETIGPARGSQRRKKFRSKTRTKTPVGNFQWQRPLVSRSRRPAGSPRSALLAAQKQTYGKRGEGSVHSSRPGTSHSGFMQSGLNHFSRPSSVNHYFPQMQRPQTSRPVQQQQIPKSFIGANRPSTSRTSAEHDLTMETLGPGVTDDFTRRPATSVGGSAILVTGTFPQHRMTQSSLGQRSTSGRSTPFRYNRAAAERRQSPPKALRPKTALLFPPAAWGVNSNAISPALACGQVKQNLSVGPVPLPNSNPSVLQSRYSFTNIDHYQ